MDYTLAMALVQWAGMWTTCGLLLWMHVMLWRTVRQACAVSAELREVSDDLADAVARLEALTGQGCQD